MIARASLCLLLVVGPAFGWGGNALPQGLGPDHPPCRIHEVPERPQARLQCVGADLELEFDRANDPEAIELLLDQIQKGYFSGGRAEFHSEWILLSPAAVLPDGSRIPEGTLPWTLQFGPEPASGPVHMTVTKGSEQIAKLIKLSPTAPGIRVQRMVRLK